MCGVDMLKATTKATLHLLLWQKEVNKVIWFDSNVFGVLNRLYPFISLYIYIYRVDTCQPNPTQTMHGSGTGCAKWPTTRPWPDSNPTRHLNRSTHTRHFSCKQSRGMRPTGIKLPTSSSCVPSSTTPHITYFTSILQFCWLHIQSKTLATTKLNKI
jgi:hypothetical protein